MEGSAEGNLSAWGRKTADCSVEEMQLQSHLSIFNYDYDKQNIVMFKYSTYNTTTE